MNYRNPVIPGFHPDPSICRVGDDFYLVTSSFEYFPGVPVYHSKNLVNWRQIGHCLTRDSQLPLSGSSISSGIFAPTIRHHEGRFYMVTTNMTQGGNFYVWSDDPAGEWSEPIWVDQGGIDPDLFWDDDGSAYFTSSTFEVRKIDIETGGFLEAPIKVWNGTGHACPEAPHLYKINGFYYLMIAEGGTEQGHSVTIARASSLQGPWEGCPTNPILTHRGLQHPIQATGHADMVEDQHGNWWMVCLGIRPRRYPKYHLLGRETFLTPLSWEDGWPVVGNAGRIAMEMEGPDGLPAVEPCSYHTKDTFDTNSLPLYWNFLCNPAANSWSLEEGHLRLRCAEPDLNTMEGQSWVGRRQQHWWFRAMARLDFTSQSESEEAGITVFQNRNHHYEAGIVGQGETRRLIVRRTIGTLSAEVASQPIPEGPVTLVIEGVPAEYSLGYLSEDGSTVILAKGEGRYLSTEVGGAFTGVYLAMYATAHGEASDNDARFSSFEYQPLNPPEGIS